eukprot:1027492-Amphidinium_carterae.1
MITMRQTNELLGSAAVGDNLLSVVLNDKLRLRCHRERTGGLVHPLASSSEVALGQSLLRWLVDGDVCGFDVSDLLDGSPSGVVRIRVGKPGQKAPVRGARVEVLCFVRRRDCKVFKLLITFHINNSPSLASTALGIQNWLFHILVS